MENDPVVLPNGRVYGKERLRAMSDKLGIGVDHYKDPTTSEIFETSQAKKVYIS